MRDAVIPLLERDIVEDKALVGFIERFCKEDAKKELDKGMNRVAKAMFEERGVSDEALKRHQDVMEKLKHLQTNIQSGQAKPHLAYSSVVDEFMVEYPKSPFAGLFGKIFVPRRKLKPVVKKRETIPLEGVKEAKLRIHISSGINVPIREGSL